MKIVMDRKQHEILKALALGPCRIDALDRICYPESGTDVLKNLSWTCDAYGLSFHVLKESRGYGYSSLVLATGARFILHENEFRIVDGSLLQKAWDIAMQELTHA